ncbi:uncharacterized protein LOC126589799 [Malus sylvestris]|uniref:uncharacterized protein LOC126589799 n=1 Tax=Malus sylvestris TaxID=3752 RepID=UPI0021ACD819|nr:uncharacterized protein LOC126589799 [Malus sylvestris]
MWKDILLCFSWTLMSASIILTKLQDLVVVCWFIALWEDPKGFNAELLCLRGFLANRGIGGCLRWESHKRDEEDTTLTEKRTRNQKRRREKDEERMTDVRRKLQLIHNHMIYNEPLIC